MKARELMQSPVITVPPEMPLIDVQELFVEANIDGAPVVDDRGVVIGILTSTDLLRTLDQVSDDEVDPGPDDVSAGLTTVTARDMATPDVVWVAPDTLVRDVARRMLAEGIHRVLVGENGALQGILTAFDLLRVIAH